MRALKVSVCLLILLPMTSYSNSKIELDVASKNNNLKESINIKEDRHNFELQLGVDSFFRKDTLFYQSRGASEYLTNATLNYKFQDIKKSTKTIIDVGAVFSPEEEFIYPNAREFYYSIKTKDSNITIGRKKQNWFKQDELWGQGLWQPRFSRDRLRPETQGLMAAFYKRKYKSWVFTGFASPIFAPEIPPAFKISDGQFSSANPWFKAPMPTIDFAEIEGETPIHFELAEFDVWNDILSNPTIGAHSQYRKGPYSLSMGYTYKPINQMLMEFPFELNIGGDEDQVNIFIHPKVVNHHVLSAEGEFNASNWTARVSLSHEVPDENDSPDDWVSYGLTDATIASAYLGLDLFSKNSGSKIYTSILKVWGGDTADNGPQIILNGKKFFERRYNYTEAFLVGVKHNISKWIKKASSISAEFIYDSAQNGAIVSSTFNMKYSKQTSFKFSFDMIGLVNDSTPQISDGFIGNFRANDRVMAEVKYEF